MDSTALEALIAVARAALKVDRDNLDNAMVHPCDHRNDAVRRATLIGPARELSEALAALPPSLRAAARQDPQAPPRYYEIISPYSHQVIGVTADPRSVLEEEPGAQFAEISRARAEAYGDDPWTEPVGTPGTSLD